MYRGRDVGSGIWHLKNFSKVKKGERDTPQRGLGSFNNLKQWDSWDNWDNVF